MDDSVQQIRHLAVWEKYASRYQTVSEKTSLIWNPLVLGVGDIRSEMMARPIRMIVNVTWRLVLAHTLLRSYIAHGPVTVLLL